MLLLLQSNSVDSCLSVIAQALMESCSTSDLKLSKDSPSSKLLFAKDISNYQELVRGYYDAIKYEVPETTELVFNQTLAEESKVCPSPPLLVLILHFLFLSKQYMR